MKETEQKIRGQWFTPDNIEYIQIYRKRVLEV